MFSKHFRRRQISTLDSIHSMTRRAVPDEFVYFHNARKYRSDVSAYPTIGTTRGGYRYNGVRKNKSNYNEGDGEKFGNLNQFKMLQCFDF